MLPRARIHGVGRSAPASADGSEARSAGLEIRDPHREELLARVTVALHRGALTSSTRRVARS
jgi:hypothetical protein